MVSAALAPLVPAAALAETEITDARTAPVVTSTIANGAADDLKIANGGSITLTASGAAVTVDSNNQATNLGTISFNGVNDAVGILGLGGRTGLIQNASTISLLEDYSPTDADNDGDVDGVFAQGARRFGMRVTGPEPFFGSVVNAAGGAITVEGTDSAAISIETRLQGDLIMGGATTVLGDRSWAVRAEDVSGQARFTGSASATGEGSVGIQLGAVGGQVLLQGAVTSTGYRYTEHLSDEAATKLDADDLKQNGAAVRLTGSIGGGLLIDRPPADLDANVADEDGDGVADASEGTGLITSLGAAPAIEIGGAGDVVLGRVGEGDSAFGLVNKGGVYASGVHNGSTATAIRIGQANGARTVIEGGINNWSGNIEASAYQASATAVHLNPGAEVAELRNSGGAITATTTTAGAQAATAVLVEQGASLPVFRNHGIITATVNGAAGSAYGLLDKSGTVSLVENIGTIQTGLNLPSGSTATGRPVALDLTANTSGVTVRQWGVADGDDGADGVADADSDGDGVDDDQEPLIQGDVLLGSGADRVELLNGRMLGGLSFGAGADALLLDGGAAFTGVLVDGDGRLSVEVRDGKLNLLDAGALRLTSLSVGANGGLSLAIDPQATSPRIEASGAVVIDKDADVAISLSSALKGTQSFELIRAGSLSAAGLTGVQLAAPYVYTAALRVQGDSLYADMRPKTAAEIGLNRSGAQAYDAVIGSLGGNAAIEAAVLAQTGRDGFVGIYDQLLPDHSGASLMSAAAVTNAVTHAVVQRRPAGADGSSAIWAQEIFIQSEQDRVDAMGFRNRGFGVAGGLEKSTRVGAAYGMALSLASVEYKDQGAAVGEEVVMNIASGSLYLRQELGGLMADVRAGAGVAVFDSERRIVSASDGLDLTAKSDWMGWFVEAHAGLAYELALGPLRIRPRGELDYVRLSERAYEEEGAGTGADLSVDARDGSLFSGTALLSVRLEFGDDFRWGPEFTFGRRELFSGSPGRTTARFTGGGADFTLDPETAYGSATILRGALKGSTLGTVFSLEGGVETGGRYKQWDARAVVKFAF